MLAGGSAGATGGEQALNQKPAKGVRRGAGPAGYRQYRQHREPGAGECLGSGEIPAGFELSPKAVTSLLCFQG